MAAAEQVWTLEITEADAVDNVFRALGGASWLTQAERDAAFETIPVGAVSPEGARYSWIVDVLDSENDIDTEREIDEATAKRLLGVDDLEPLRARVDAEIAHAIDEWMKRRNALAPSPGTADGGTDGQR